ncbi:hypothetical protein KBZ21_45550, partial [Streptomyces sp. A73]|nr:hypothetical protein [Streptomyces sp. A73]
TQPQNMLLARATAECARLIAADVLMGMPYSAEEHADENDDTAPAPKTRKISRKKAEPAPAPEPEVTPPAPDNGADE